MTNPSGNSDRLDRIERLLETVGQRVDSNSRSIEALTSSISYMREDIATTNRKVDALVETITLFSVRSEARLNRLEDAVIGIERILAELVRRDR